MAATTETIILDSSQFVSGADAAADAADGAAEAMAILAKNAKQAGDAMAEAGYSSERGGKRFKSGFQQNVINLKDWRTLDKNQKKAGGAFEKLKGLIGDTGSAKNQRGLGGVNKKLGAMGGAASAASGVITGLAIGLGGFVIGAAAVAKLSQPFFEAAGAATIARDSMEQALDQVTGGRGEEALSMLDNLAKGLNLPVQEVTDSFIALRKEGINNIDSEALIKLRADLVKVGVSAGDADKEIDKLTKAIKDGADAGDAIEEVAVKFGAMGDGANASAASVFTLEGSLKRADLAGERFVTRLADWSSPAIDDAGIGLANIVEHLEQSDVAESALSAISAGMKAIVEAGEGIMETLMPAIEGLEGPLDDLSEAFRDSSDASGDARGAGQKLGTILGLLVSGFGLVISGAAGVINAFGALRDAASWVSDAVGGAIDAVSDGASDMYDAAVEFITGIPQAILDGIDGAAEAAGKLAQAAVDAVKSKLGMSSPSKVAAELGHNFGDSYTDAMKDAMPDDIPMLAPANTNALGGGMAPASGGGKAAPVIHIAVNVAQSNATPDDIALAVQRGAEQALRLAGVA
jgi:hypothetical protein